VRDCDDDGNGDDLRAVCLVRAIVDDLYGSLDEFMGLYLINWSCG